MCCIKGLDHMQFSQLLKTVLLKNYQKDVSSAEQSVFKQSIEPSDIHKQQFQPCAHSYQKLYIVLSWLMSIYSNKKPNKLWFCGTKNMSVLTFCQSSLCWWSERNRKDSICPLLLWLYFQANNWPASREAGGSCFPWLAGYRNVWKPCTSEEKLKNMKTP